MKKVYLVVKAEDNFPLWVCTSKKKAENDVAKYAERDGYPRLYYVELSLF